MTTVVTGANGHLGANLVRELLHRDRPVRAVVHRNRDAVEGLDVEEIRADVLDEGSLRKAFRGADTVLHLAARISIRGDPDGTVRRINVDGARNVARAAQAAGARLVHVSSVHAFDLRSRGPVTENSPRSGPRNYAYDHSKRLGEDAVRAAVADGLDATIVNPTGVVGPHDFAPSRMGKVLLDLRAGRMPALVRGAFDFVDARDVVRGILAAEQSGKPGECHLLGGTHLTVRDVAGAVASVAGSTIPRMTVPLWLAAGAIPFAAWSARGTGRDPEVTRESLGALRHGHVVDCTKARKVLGHQPRPFEETVRDTLAWFDRQGDAA